MQPHASIWNSHAAVAVFTAALTGLVGARQTAPQAPDTARGSISSKGAMRLLGELVAIMACVSALACAQTTSPRLRSYARARHVLDGGVQAIGGQEALQALRNVRRRMSGDWFGSGQGPRPENLRAPTRRLPVANSQTALTTLVDYSERRSLDESIESDATGDSITRVVIASGHAGFETIAYRDEKPYYRAFTADEARQQRLGRLRRHPEGILLMALTRPETLQWVGATSLDGRRVDVISFCDDEGIVVALSFDENGLLVRSETLREHAIAGDTSAEVIYSDYRRVGPFQLPHEYTDRVAGIPTQHMRVSAIDLDVADPDASRFEPPTIESRVTVPAVPQPEVQPVGERLYVIRGPYNVMFAVFRDYLVVFEAPVSSRYMERCLDLIRGIEPKLPVRSVVATHFHYDHVAGLRPFIAAGVPIITTADALAIVRKVAAAPGTMHPDALLRRPRPALLESVTDRRIIEDDSNRVELYQLGPFPHLEQMLVAYFPNERLLFQADLWDPISRDLPIAGSDAVDLANAISRAGLNVERIIPVHGVPSTFGDLQRRLAIRSRYLR